MGLGNPDRQRVPQHSFRFGPRSVCMLPLDSIGDSHAQGLNEGRVGRILRSLTRAPARVVRFTERTCHRVEYLLRKFRNVGRASLVCTDVHSYAHQDSIRTGAEIEGLPVQLDLGLCRDPDLHCFQYFFR